VDGPLDDLVTEAPGSGASDLDLRSTRELVALMNHEDATVPGVVAGAGDLIAAAIDSIVEQLAGGGRLIYVGAGSSGRLAAVDAAECETTFAADPGQVLALVAGSGSRRRRPRTPRRTTPKPARASSATSAS
jgi:N-acetylmuramic acid 6-phosphate etherase